MTIKHALRFAGLAAATLSVSACLGGGGGGGGSTGATVATSGIISQSGPSAADLVSEAQRLGMRADTFDEITPVSGMPTTGVAQYTGVAGGVNANDSTDRVIGRATLNADFGNSTLTGQVTDFHDVASSLAYPGTISVTNGVIVGNTISGNLSGTVSTQLGTGTANGTFSGGFGGPNAEMMGADTIVTVTTPTDVLTYEGGFIAER